MPRKPVSTPANPMRELAAMALADNADLRTRATRIVNMMLDDVERTFRIGDPKDKAIYVRQVIPALFRSMSTSDDGGSEADLKAAFERVMAAVGGGAAPAEG